MASLLILGSSLHEAPFEEALRDYFNKALLIIGESPGRTMQLLKAVFKSPPREKIFFLDNLKKTDWEELEKTFFRLAKEEGFIIVFSDCGMPFLFDPGLPLLEWSRKLKLKIVTQPGPTSFGTAMSLSGFSPPFLVCDFLPRDTQARESQLKHLANEKAHLVFLETPYRLEALLDSCERTLGIHRECFWAWEIGKPAQDYFWGTFAALKAYCKEKNYAKGEFVLIVKRVGINAGSTKKNK